MNSHPAMDPVRKLISQICEDRGIALAELSRQLGRNHAYMQQFMERGVPRTLPEGVRLRLSELLGVDEAALGAPPKRQNRATVVDAGGLSLINIDQHDVRASAGHGSLISEETVVGQWPFPREYVRHTLSIRSGRLSLIEVIGDSMEPTLRSGDQILVDLDDFNVSQPGVFALHDGDATVVKRVERIPGTDPAELVLISDNSMHGRYQVRADQVNVAGRVVWFGRRL